MPGSTFLVLRGVVSLLVGIVAFLWPGITLVALVALFALYAFLDGIVNLVLGFTRTATHDHSWTQVLAGVVAIVVGGLAVTMPEVTLFWLIMLIAAWAIVRGVLDVAAAVELRRVIRGEWLLAVTGLLSIAFGILVVVFPDVGALSVAWLLGFYAFIWGIALVSLGLRLRKQVVA